MDERILHLTDGSTVSAKVNFGTIYYMQKVGFNRLAAKKQDQMTQNEKFDMAAKMIYVLLRSNGRNVTFDEAMVLAPLDVTEGSEFDAVFEEFKTKLENYTKKVEARQATKMMIASK